ncbi:MAG: cytochrome c oxidase subunit II [Actinomycetota bacterium]|nr:cytochrome c oxidase subunit II [Actinomycetota bacterium]
MGKIRAGLFLVPVFLITACSKASQDEALRIGFPEPVTQEGVLILNLWQGTWIVAIGVAALVLGLLFAAIILYRRRSDAEVPKQTRYNIPLEILYTVVPFVIVLGLFYFTARDQSTLIKLSGEQKHTVSVVGFRWSWAFNYLEGGAYEIGTPALPPTLYLPVDEKVKFELTSPDVIHSFWIPAFLMKMDVVPGRLNAFELTPTKTGEFVGKCAELCGVDHSRMLFNVKVVSRSEFDQHIQDLKAAGQEGVLETDRIATKGNPDCLGNPELAGCK